jgi:DNA-binding NtrC family response regulator
MNRHRIMVIDDEKIVCDMAKLSLQQEGYVVETFVSPATALKRLEEQKFDVVVTDYRMQDIDGMEVLRTVKSQYPTTQVIMMTAYANLDSALEALRRDVHDFFAKPVKIKDLKASIKRALEKDTWVFRTC